MNRGEKQPWGVVAAFLFILLWGTESYAATAHYTMVCNFKDSIDIGGCTGERAECYNLLCDGCKKAGGRCGKFYRDSRTSSPEPLPPDYYILYIEDVYQIEQIPCRRIDPSTTTSIFTIPMDCLNVF